MRAFSARSRSRRRTRSSKRRDGARSNGSSHARMIPTFGCRVIEAYPHDPLAFTQGLLWHRGALYESTGLIGRSTVRRVRLRDGRVLRSAVLPAQMFGEGLAGWGDEIVSLTYRD